jgi:5-methylcytosine-specific restriction endonuclease McrA
MNIVKADITSETRGSEKSIHRSHPVSFVFVVDTNKQPLNPVHPGRARLLLNAGKAAVLKRYPFTIVLKTAVEQPQIQFLRIKLDPGSQTTGIAIVDEQGSQVLFAAELAHRGQDIKKALDGRRANRRGRRARHTRYRKPKFDNRSRPKGWLAPSLESRVCNVETWVNRLRKLCSITAISMELVRFDMQAQENPEISGTQYQQGTLAGYEVKEYLLEKWGRACSYCGKQNVPLEVEHIQARANGGTDRVSNLCLACVACNTSKGTQDITVFLAKQPDVLKRIQAQAKAPLTSASAVNSTRWALLERLKGTGLPVECGSGGLTKYNRSIRSFSKTHWLDASCVGASTPAVLKISQVRPLFIRATGHGRRQMCLMDARGFPRTQPKAKHFPHEFRTGDIVKAVVPAHLKNSGVHVGRMSARAKGAFTIDTNRGKVTDIGKKYCRMLQKTDGYGYAQGSTPAGAFLSSLSLKHEGPQKGFQWKNA